jgi:5-formyltetrahydrofolate cyclo-ligase
MNQPDASVDANNKAALRARALARRDALDEAARVAASESIAGRASGILTSLQPDSMALYLPIGSECETAALMNQARLMGAEIGLPAVIDGSRMLFRRYRAGDRLVAEKFGTSAPSPGAPLVEPDVIVMPLLAFDRLGERLGYGRGYYDRAIITLREAGQRPKLLGIAFSVQEVPSIPTEPHDVRLDWIVTETETIELGANKD